MKDLDIKEIYSLENIKKDEVKFNILKDWLKKNDKGWDRLSLYDLKDYRCIHYDNHYKDWDCSNSEDSTICALTLFEEEQNLNADIYPNLFFDQIEELKKTANKLGLTIDILIKNK